MIKPGAGQPLLSKEASDLAPSRLDKFRHAEGSLAIAKIRDAIQRTMQADFAVFRTERTLAEGISKIDAVDTKGARGGRAFSS